MEPVQMEKMERDPMEMALSTDVVMDKVMSHLKVADLLSCREVSKIWRRAASSVLRKRSTMTTLISNANLIKLAECMRSSSDFPFSGLQLHQLWKFRPDLAMEFFRKYGDRFTSLRLKICWRMLNSLAPFIIYLPRLSILQVRGRQRGQRSVELLDSAARQRYGGDLELPSVRLIRIWSCDKVTKDILHEIVTAASPSVQIECLDAGPETLRVLRSGGKLQAVSVLKFNADRSHGGWRFELMREMDQLLSIESPSLSKLEFTANVCRRADGLEKILFASQHTLKELHLDGGWLSEYSWKNLPVLAKLTKLSLRHDFCHGPVFRGRHGNIFPALKELHLHFENFYVGNRNVGDCYPSDLLVVPSVTRIDLEGYVDEDGMRKLAQSFPNVADIRLNYNSYGGYVPRRRNPFQIWSVGKFKCLEKLRIWNVTVRPLTNTCLTMDSFLTGMPVEVCRNLHEQEKQLDAVDALPHEVVRNNPSILQLENLKELVVCVKPGSRMEPEVTPFISMVSVGYALDMMPNLQAKFVFERLRCDELDLTTLEAAFKHVQPWIKLEPFFY